MAANFLVSQPHNLTFSSWPSSASIRSPKFCMAATLPSTSGEVKNLKIHVGSAQKVRSKTLHSPLQQKVEIINSMEDWAVSNILTLLKPVGKCWQPQDFLPNSTSDRFFEQVEELRQRTKEMPDDYFVALVGDMITEEALPTYQTRFNCMEGIWDETGVSTSPWAVWSRAWTAEENRHGDLLNKYLYLSGRIDMKQVEKTVQYLIGSGVDIGTENDPYKFFIYTSFQERATFTAHGNTARLAMKHGDTKLAQICGLIAAEEKRHEAAYSKVMEKIFEIDPNGAVIAFADMMRRKITMPGHLMYDGHDHNLYAHFSIVASRIGVYSASDYVDILEHLVERWNVSNLRCLSGEGKKAQDYICGLSRRLRRIIEGAEEKAKKSPTLPFSWIFKNGVSI